MLLRRLQVVGGQVGGPILMESGMRHRKVNQSTRSHHCRCINERSHTASPCYYYHALPHRARWQSWAVSKGPETCHGRDNCAFAVPATSPEPCSSPCHSSASAVSSCSPSFDHQPRAQLGESEHHTTSFPRRCHVGAIFSKNSLRNRTLSMSWHCPRSSASTLPKSLLRPAANNFFGLRLASPAPSCSGRTCHHD